MSEAPAPSPSTQSAASAGLGSVAAEHRHITDRAGTVALGTLLSRALGLVRDTVIAAVFPRAATDAFFIAFTIPNVLRQLLAEGAVQSAILPVLAETRETEGDAAAREFFRTLRGLSLALLLAVTLAGVVGSSVLVDLFAGGFRKYSGQFERTVTLTQWVFPYIFFMSSAALGVAALNTYGRFFVSAFAPGLLNVSFIVCALTLPGVMAGEHHDPALALAAGALLGGALQVAAQWPSLKRIGYMGWPTFNLGHPGVRKVVRRMAPVLLGIGVYFIDVVLARHFLSDLGTGAQSYFSWALRLCDFPQGIFVMAIQSATLPSLSRLVAQKRLEDVAETFSFGLRLALFVGLPATAFLVGLAHPLVVLIFERGAFDAEASAETARALEAQALGVWTIAAVRQLVAVYYALGDTRTPVKVAALDLVAFVAFAVVLKPRFGHVGVNLAIAGSSLVQMCLLFLLLQNRIPRLHLARLARTTGKTLIAAVTAVSVARWVAVTAAEFLAGGGGAPKLLPGLLAACSFAVVFLLVARLVRSEELATLWIAVRRRRTRS